MDKIPLVEEGNLTRNVSTLRKALGESRDDHRYIVTIPGRGYRFVANVRETQAEDAKPSCAESEGKDRLRGFGMAVVNDRLRSLGRGRPYRYFESQAATVAS